MELFYWKILISFIKSKNSLEPQQKYFFYECFVEKINSQLVSGRKRGKQEDNHLTEKDGKVVPWALTTYYKSQWYHLDFTVKLNSMCQQSNLKLLGRCQLHICHVSDQERCFSWAVAESFQGMLFFHTLCNGCGGLQGFKKVIPNLCKSWILCIYVFFIQNFFYSCWETSEKPGGSHWIRGFRWTLQAGLVLHYFQTKFYHKSSQSL